MTIKIFCSLLLLLVFVVPLSAQPPRSQVLGDVGFVELAEAAEVRVAFNFPVRYISHFPNRTGDELRIKLSPIAIAEVDRKALFHRESYIPRKPNLAGISEILYEGDTFSGLYLTIYFRGIASWQVVQGGDYRSLQIRVLTPFPTIPEEGRGE